MYQALMVGTSLLSAYGKYQEAKANASLMQEQAGLLELSAERVMELNAYNTEQTRLDERLTKSATGTAAVASGFGVNLNTLTEITNAATKEIKLNTEEAEFQSRKYKLEAEQKRRAAKNTLKAGKLSAFSSILGGVAPLAK